MKVLIADIPDDGLTLDLEEKFVSEEYTAVSPVMAHLEIRRSGPEIIISGMMRTEMQFRCSRCLKPFTREMDIPMNMVYHPVGDMTGEKHELKDDEMDMGFYSGDELDMKDIITEQVLLNVQMKPLCDEGCRGICPKCGKDLSAEECSCETRETDPRLEVLRTLFEKGKE